jgi:membrane fusion protein, heavy metal efflux system
MIKNIISIVCIVMGLVSCKSHSNSSSIPGDSIKLKETSIRFSKAQMEMAEIKTGKIEKKALSATLECTGYIEAPPQNLVSVSAPMGGFIKTMNFFPGNFVKAGALLATLEHPGYIIIQQEFLQTKNTLDYYREEYKRQGELTLENAVSMKKMQLAQSDYKSLEAKYSSLKKQLRFIGIEPEKLTSENISSVISLYAPISGYISKVEGNTGKYIATDQVFYEIVDKSHLHLQLKVFEKDVCKIKEHQKIRFRLTGDLSHTFMAEIEAVGQMIDEKERAVLVHAHIKDAYTGFIPGMYVNAQIILSDVQVLCLPVTSLVKQNNQYSIFLAGESTYDRVRVQTGIEQDQYVEIINPDSLLLRSDIVTEGAYYIESELLKKQSK